MTRVYQNEDLCHLFFVFPLLVKLMITNQNINLCITEQNKSPILIQISFITPTYQYFQGQWGRNAASILHKSPHLLIKRDKILPFLPTIKNA